MTARIPSFSVSFFPRLLACLLLVLACCNPEARAQAPGWQAVLALTSGSGPVPEVAAQATDASGNIFLTGRLVGTVAFGTTTLTSAGNGDIFVAKWSPTTGQFVWAQRAGGTSSEVAMGLAVSGTNVYVSGYFTSATADFGPVTLTNSNSGTTSATDVFVAKLTDSGSSGAFVWAQRARGSWAVVAASGSNVYVAGHFGGPQADFGNIVLQNSGNLLYLDAFVAKLTDDGATGRFVWAQQVGGANTDWIFSVAASGSNVYVGGGFNSAAAVFGPATLANGGQTDAFVAKLTDAGATGQFVWAQRAGGASAERVNALAVSGPSVYAVGGFSSSSAAFGGTTLGSVGDNDVFVAKLTDAGATGSFVWAQRGGGPATNSAGDQAQTVAVSGTSLYVAGTFAGATATFGGTTLTRGSTARTSIFLTRLVDAGPTGSFAWTQAAGGDVSNTAVGVGVIGSRVYLTGGVITPALFGSTLLTAANGSVAYMAVVADPLALAAGAPATAWAGTIELAPNPAHAVAEVRVAAVAGATQLSLTLCDALGRVVHTEQLALPAVGARATVPLTGLAPGLYQLRVQAGSWRAVRALVVE